MDHPSNVGHPTPFHVRDAGWMGISANLSRAITIEPGKPLRFRYALWIHKGVPDLELTERQWQAFARSERLVLTPARR